MTTCIQCHTELTPLNDIASTYQFDNALWIGFFGGYGMFIEEFEYVHDNPSSITRHVPGATHEAVLCHDCAHELSETIPWIGKLLNPYTSHTHTQAYTEAHPHHQGVDIQDEDSVE